MTADRWTQAVRQQLGLGRLLPLGGAHEGAWISEGAAGAVLRIAAEEVRGISLGPVRISLSDPETAGEPAVPAPPGALPPGSLRVSAEFAATAAEPLPVRAARLRAALAGAADRLGLTVAEVDLSVTALLDEAPEPSAVERPEPRQAPEPVDAEESRAAAAALAVPGVLCLTDVLGRPVHIDQGPAEPGALPRRHVRLELAVRTDHRAVDVAREVRAEVERALPDHPTVAVLVTATG